MRESSSISRNPNAFKSWQSQSSHPSIQGRNVEIRPPFSGLYRLYLSSLSISGHRTFKKAVGKTRRGGGGGRKLGRLAKQYKIVYFGEEKVKLISVIKYIGVWVKKITVQLYSVTTKHKTRGN